MTLMPRLMLLLLALSPLSALAAAPPALVEGKDYELIEQPGPYAPLAGKVEVVEMFGYTCPHCARFEPQLEAWAAKLPKDVRFTPVPAAFGGVWDSFARAYYAADQLGVAKRSHRAMFDALHEQRSLPMQNVSPDELATFYKAYGVEPARYLAALKDPAVDEKIKAARSFAQRTQVPGTPALVVNGRYLVKGDSFEAMLRNADALIARARGERAR
ncbi:thiol:disulfide interchange protein DsbA/DsbL [Stenotrophomonas rhizophila]|uniref:thiol:disulfide interchange protein DsbA/DsbL n=1 Tax=Stenotrophomonas rhizophila TaxID=216778 RepID=UPI001E51DC4F|nr:thiol:disulfide interchange protein DsbA/DsbL [Stenotrophomonas rhizophila]MCC7633772.1 thiol:disulfide interchange protein DsbA/DsbL [Stenotrophomonas rhizophila]MCC7663718.1 thiol:disulfide interchange protein DsbA/DsbL [Stenotrophomonas rhizophila]